MVNTAAIRVKISDVQLQRIKEEIIAELLASGGVSYDRAALELLYYIPDTFKHAYTEVFYEAFAGTDGNLDARGRQGAETAALGRASGKAAGKTTAKRGTFFIQNELVLEIKDRADKRLRALARDMRRDLDEVRSTQVSKDKSGAGVYARQQVDEDIRAGNNGQLRAVCDRCRKFVSSDWQWCARCGNKLGD